jgi:hypothetical protein
VAPSTLDQRVVEHRLVVVLAGDHGDLVFAGRLGLAPRRARVKTPT